MGINKIADEVRKVTDNTNPPGYVVCLCRSVAIPADSVKEGQTVICGHCFHVDCPCVQRRNLQPLAEVMR